MPQFLELIFFHVKSTLIYQKNLGTTKAILNWME